MAKIACDRCGKIEAIPTHQFVKFDDKVRYLCSECWDWFRRWFQDPDADDPKPDKT
ncbi:MAG: hypothetical protein L0216_16370 [Planctomycetales bacterium]|nr:hypothetical protein [Planctomycetales bacterium]